MVSLTRKAAEKVRCRSDRKRYLRLIAYKNGAECIDYKIDYTDKVNNDDILYMSYGIKLLVGRSTRRYFEDMKVDFKGSNGSGKFIFDTTEVLGAEI